MPKFNVSIPHALHQEEAKQRLDRFAESAGSSDKVSNLEQTWDGNRLHFGFKTYGIQIKGVMTVADNQLDVDGELPFSAMMFKGKIESGVKEMLAKLMSA